jgi:hypothetical protein
MIAVARRGSTSFVLGWRLRALHVDPLLVDGRAAWTEEERGEVGLEVGGSGVASEVVRCYVSRPKS